MIKIVHKEKIIPLAALAIALFMALPRIAVIAYLKVNPDSRMSDITWLDLASKYLYSFLVAWGFLWLNVREPEPSSGLKVIRFNRFANRLALNLIFFILVRLAFRLFGIPGESELRPGKGLVFLFNMSLAIEVVLCILIGEIYRLVKKNEHQRLSNEKLLKANAEATFEVLKNQVNPHFLFNSLNTINAMVDSDVSGAKRFVTNMSNVYRHILNSAGKKVITLAEELEFTNAYINMLLVRHGNSLCIAIDISDSYLSHFLPPISLQVLIENAVKHNVVSIGHPLTINIREKDGNIVVSHQMNLRKSKSISTGTGLLNLDLRYQHLCAKKIEISNTNDIFTVAIPLLKNIQ